MALRFNKLDTERTFLRPFVIEDAQDLFRYRSDSKTNRYQSWTPKNIEEVKNYIRSFPIEFDLVTTWFQLGIVLKESEQIIGDIGIHFKDQKQCEIGITIDKRYHGCGYATETLRTLFTYLFTELNKHRITASIDPRNISSLRLMERLNMRKEAHFRASLYIKGEWVDDIIYAILSQEWK